MYKYHCVHCNRNFESTSDSPVRCPLCHAVNFDKLLGANRNCPTGTKLGGKYGKRYTKTT